VGRLVHHRHHGLAQKSPSLTDLDKAREHLAKSSYADGFECAFSISLGQLDWVWSPQRSWIIEALA
jgi:peptide/nickel transport system substrate-binding protein